MTTIEEAIKAAIEFETRIRDVYADALTHMGFWFDFPEFNLEANA